MDHEQDKMKQLPGISRQEETQYLAKTLAVVSDNIENYRKEVSRMQAQIDEMLAHYHDNDTEVYTMLSNTVTLHDHMKHALAKNEKAKAKPYFGRIIFQDRSLQKEESIYIGKGGIPKDTTHWMVIDWRAPAANVYYENGLGPCSYSAPGSAKIDIDLKLKRTYEIEDGKLLDFFDTEVVANDDLLTKYLAKNKQAVLGEIIATIQKEQNEIIRKSPYHNIIVQGVAGSGKTTVAMHRISFILYNYEERFKPDDFYIVGSNRILLNYITGVLPDLDVYGIRQMTMEQLFVRLLYEDWDDKKYHILGADKMDAKSSIKGTLSWFRDLEEYCRKLEWDTIDRASVYLNPKQFVEGIRDGKPGVYDETGGHNKREDLIELIPRDTVERYIRKNPGISVQSKINMLNERLLVKIKDEFLGKGISYTESEQKAIRSAYRGRYGGRIWKQSIFTMYRDFLTEQSAKGHDIEFPTTDFDVYDLAALAYLYKRIKETEVISEAHHVVIDEAQDFGMMAYYVLKFCIKDCTYTIMGDVSQNIHFGYGLNDWEELKELLLTDNMDSFGVLKKSYRNTVEISNFATNILHHGQFSIYPVEPIIRHGKPVEVLHVAGKNAMLKKAAEICGCWQKQGLDTIAIVCRNQNSAKAAADELKQYIDVIESDPEKAVFGSGIMILPVEYTKGLEFDAVLLLDPTREEYPVDDGHAKLLYVAATRALHELCVLHTGNLTGLITDPLPERPAETDISETVPATTPTAISAADRAKDTVNGSASASAQYEHDAPKHPDVSKPVPKKKICITRAKPTPITAPQNDNSSKQTGQNNIQTDKKHTLSNKNILSGSIGSNTARPATTDKSGICFGDMPATEKLRPAGHSKIDLAIRWVTKQSDGLYLQSRYGILRLSPVGSAIIRITFTRNQQFLPGTNAKIAVSHIDRTWMYRESGGAVELLTDELCLQIDKISGRICYMTRNKKPLVSERSKECRQIEASLNGTNNTWLFFDWPKGENLYAMGAQDISGMNLRGSARYFSHDANTGELPLLLSDKGYGILLATDGPALFCDIPTYGSYLHTETEEQIDFYFIAGKRPDTIMKAYAYLCGRL